MGGRGVRSSARLSGGAGSARAVAAGVGEAGAAASGAGEAAARRARAADARLRRERAAERAREVEDSPRVLRDKCRLLARALLNAKHLVVYTGAGISTAADIPDYRGPCGVWTRLRRGESVGRVEVSLAQPTFTHMALAALCARGTLKFLVSQNCDGLHMRAGVPRRALAELHGNMFAERCAACRRLYLRAFDVTERTRRHAHGTRRLCHDCGAELRDTIVHFGERGRAAWPLNWAGALRHAAAADVVLCLGSSLKVLRRYPRLWRMQRAPRDRPALYIVNLQWTPKDDVAALKINARCDAVMAQVARLVRLRVPPYCPRADPLPAHATPTAAREAHTHARPALRLPGRCTCGAHSDSDSDPDDELPLRALASRLRRARSADAPSAPPTAPPAAPSLRTHAEPLPEPHFKHRPGIAAPRLTSFQVSLQDGDATILLRPEHSPPSGSALRRVRLPPRAPVAPAPPAPPAHPAARSPVSARRENGLLPRRVIAAPMSLDFDSRENDYDDRHDIENKFQTEIKYQPLNKLYFSNNFDSVNKFDVEDKFGYDSKFDIENKLDADDRFCYEDKYDAENKMNDENKLDSDDRLQFEESLDTDEAGAAKRARRGSPAGWDSCRAAAAIMRRALRVCRAQLYPGLHTIIPPAPAPAPRAAAAPAPRTAAPRRVQCAWCWRRRGARRCLWYGPARVTRPAARAWRRRGGRRYLCACCPGGEPARDSGGWYGKGYRKGRRARRRRPAPPDAPPDD